MTADHQLNKIMTGDLEAIEELCLATWEPLYRYIYYKVQNREEAEDITQETYVKTLAYLQKNVINLDNLSGFLRTVALNIIRDKWRSNKRRGTTAKIDKLDLLASDKVDEHDIINQRMEVQAGMEKLSAEYQAILDLRIMQGYTVAETAKMLKKSEAAVRTAQYRALHSLAQILDHS